MTRAAQADKNPLERTLQSWVDWGVGTAGPGRAGFDEGDPADCGYDDLDWEDNLRRQNASNDELSSENARLQAEVERFRKEERDAAKAALEGEEPPEPESAGFEDEFLEAVIVAVQEVLAGWAHAEKGNSPHIEDGTQRAVALVDPNLQGFMHETEDDVLLQNTACNHETSTDDQSTLTSFGAHEQEDDDEERAERVAPAEDSLVVETLRVQESTEAHQTAAELVTDVASSTLPLDADANQALQDTAGEESSNETTSEVADVLDTIADCKTERTLPLDTSPIDAETSNSDGAAEEDSSQPKPLVSTDADTREPGELDIDDKRQSLHNVAEEGVEANVAEEGVEAFHNVAWRDGVTKSLKAAMQAAFQEDAELRTDAPNLNRAEETAMLVSEKMELRLLVESQQEQIEELQEVLHEAGASLPLGAAFGGALGRVQNIAKDFSEAGDAIHAGWSSGLSGILAPKEAKKIAEIGVEYEVVGRRGAIVRTEETLGSDRIAELPPGTRVRVCSISELYPRRVEIVAVSVCKLGAGSQSVPSSVQLAVVDENAGDSARPSTPRDNGDAQAQSAPVVGWISASTKDGSMLIRPAPPEASANGAEDFGSPEPENKEEGVQEVAQVTLSAIEWECLHQDQEAQLRKVEALSATLNEKGCQLLQVFEMRSVLREMELTASRALERRNRMYEIAALSTEELDQWRADNISKSIPCLVEEQAACERQAEVENIVEQVGQQSEPEAVSESPPLLPAATVRATSSSSKACEEGGDPSPVGMDAVDWDRLLSERETTSAALCVALRRKECLERETEELRAETENEQGRDKMERELRGLRSTLRRLAAPTMQAVTDRLPGFLQGSKDMSSPTAQEGGATSSGEGESLFKRRVEDMRHTVAGLKLELRRAQSSESDLRKSVEARRWALRDLLRRGATAGLAAVQCGPITIPANPDAERRALVVAVEEQLQFNLMLRPGPAQSQTRSFGTDEEESDYSP